MSGGRAEEKIIGDACGSGHEAAFAMAGTTKQDSDCEDALDRIFRIAHAGPYGARDVVVVEGYEETYFLMVNLKKSHPEKYACLLPMPGVWHFLFHATKGLVGRYYSVGLESVCKILDADDKHTFQQSSDVACSCFF